MMDVNDFMGLRSLNWRAQDLLEWFLKNTLDQYLDQNANSIVSNLKKDMPQKEIRQFILEYEKSHKNRKEVLACLLS